MKSLRAALARIEAGKARNVRSIVRMVSLNDGRPQAKDFLVPLLPFVFVLCGYCNLQETNQRLHFRFLVHTSYGVTIYPFEEDLSFCCGPGNSSSNTCINSTRGSSAPFPVPAGRVIFNRTSGSISPNNSDAAAVTVSSTAAPATTATPPTDPTICRNSPSSSNKSTAVGFGVGVPLGLALLGALGLLWRQRSRELGARREARAWEEKYDELIKEENRGDLIGHERQVQELGCDCLKPDELDGRLVYEVAGT